MKNKSRGSKPLKLGSVVRLCKQDLYFYQQCIFVSYINSRNMNLVCDVALYFRKEYAPFLTIFNSDWKVIDFLRHISESCIYFKKCHISRYISHILYFRIIPTIPQKFHGNFLGPKLAHTLYSPFVNVFLLFCCYHTVENG